MEIGICDDEKVYCEAMISYCQKAFADCEPGFHVFHSGDEMLASKLQFDLLFLDIEMPGMDGIGVKNFLQDGNRKDKIVFLTSHEERMREAFGANVLDFISKPIVPAEVEKTLQKLKKVLGRKTIAISLDGVERRISLDEIQYVEAEDKYVSVHVAGESLLLRQTLTEWEELLPEPFFCRCSRFCIINMEYYNHKKSAAVIGELTIPVGRTYKKAVMNVYQEFLRRKDE
ncbi:MAG: response regulator transcription factor [Lachnospiraceae bacterium]|nr:response regulator transcription factor [Lachnospiraceae bacterium]